MISHVFQSDHFEISLHQSQQTYPTPQDLRIIHKIGFFPHIRTLFKLYRHATRSIPFIFRIRYQKIRIYAGSPYLVNRKQSILHRTVTRPYDIPHDHFLIIRIQVYPFILRQYPGYRPGSLILRRQRNLVFRFVCPSRFMAFIPRLIARLPGLFRILPLFRR